MDIVHQKGILLYMDNILMHKIRTKLKLIVLKRAKMEVQWLCFMLFLCTNCIF